ncbi:reverse transcriptase domain-containing protein [Tanacetum coccineum]
MFALLPSINSIRWIACHLSQPIIDVRIAKVAFPLTSRMTYWLLEEPNSPLQEIIIPDPDGQPIWENAKTVAPNTNSAIIQPTVDDNFFINSTRLKMILENKSDGQFQADPHDHIREFLAICDMFKYGKTQSEAVKLLIFPFSLCDKAKTWFNELNEESITSWEQMRKAFINKFFPPSLLNRLLLEIRDFSQNECESLTDAWLRLKNMLRKCNGHEELQDMRKKYDDLRYHHAFKNRMNDDTAMCERHEVNYIQYEGYRNRYSHDSSSLQSHSEQL